MSLGALAAIGYGILAAAGGLMGYAQARSQLSLISGLVSGALLLLGGWLWLQSNAAGAPLSLGVTLALVIVFIRRYQQTGKFMPAGLMIALGAVALGLMALTLL